MQNAIKSKILMTSDINLGYLSYFQLLAEILNDIEMTC